MALERLDEDLREALKASQQLKVQTLRMLKAALKNREIHKGGPLTQEEALAVLRSLIKQRQEAQESFSRAGRQEQAQKEAQEMAILRAYLPRELSEEELSGLIGQCIQEAGATGPRDLGKVMRLLMPRLKGAADGRVVNQMVRKALEAMEAGK
mgnify:CR=1 FL=1|jgi:hypothetical protein